MRQYAVIRTYSESHDTKPGVVERVPGQFIGPDDKTSEGFAQAFVDWVVRNGGNEYGCGYEAIPLGEYLARSEIVPPSGKQVCPRCGQPSKYWRLCRDCKQEQRFEERAFRRGEI